MFMHRLSLVLALSTGLFASLLCAVPAHADSISLVGDDDIDQTDLASQLGLDLTDGGTTVSFAFTNNVGTASNVAEIYFNQLLATWLDLGTIAVVNASSGSDTPDFQTGALAPPNPPGLAGWEDTGAGGDTGNGSGINEAEDTVTFTFDLVGTYAGLLGALNNVDGESGALIGMHIRSIDPAGGSDTYYNGPSNPDQELPPMPEPATVWLLGLGVIGVAARRRLLR